MKRMENVLNIENPQDIDLETKIKTILSYRPCSIDTLSILTKSNSRDIIHKMRQLERWKIVKPVTKKYMIMWGLYED